MATRKRQTNDVPFLAVEPESPTSTYELERYVLGTILNDPSQVNVVAEIITPDKFSSSSHSQIFETIMKMDDKHLPIDIVPVIEELRNQQILEGVGGISYLSSLVDKTIYPGNLPAYCKMIQNKWILRELNRLAGEVQAEIQQPGIEAEELLNDYTGRIFELSRGNRQGGFRVLRDLLNPAHEKLAEFRKRHGNLVGIGTGFHYLDEMTGGFQNSELIILAARPSVGKTSLALDFALTAARDYGKKVGFISLEMAWDQIVLRLLATQSKLELHKLRSGRINDEEYDVLRTATEPLYPIPFYIDDGSNQSLNEIRAKVRRMKKEKGLDIVFLDYLGLMQQPSNTESVQVAISGFTRGLKALAKELQIPIVVLAQLSRAAVDNDKSDKRPKLHHLRDSGSIEQDADVVIMLYREFYDKGKSREEMTEEEKAKEYEAEIIIAKQRNGPVGTVKVIFKKEYASFEEADRAFAIPDAPPPSGRHIVQRTGSKPQPTAQVPQPESEEDKPF